MLSLCPQVVLMSLLWCPKCCDFIVCIVLLCFTVLKQCVIVFILQCLVSLLTEMLSSVSCPGTTDENELIANSGTANELCIVPVK